MRVRRRTGADLDDCERLANEVLGADRYPPYLPGDLRSFLVTPTPLGAWVAELAAGLAGHVALHRRSSGPVMAMGSVATGRPVERLAVVARLLVAPSARRQGVGRRLLHTAASAAAAHDLWPILDVAAQFSAAIALYETCGWERAGTVLVPLPNGSSVEELVFLGPRPVAHGTSATAVPA